MVRSRLRTIAGHAKDHQAMHRRYPSRPFVGVGVVCLKGDLVLLVRRGRPPRKGEWSIPGGLQHAGETLAEAALRELREETGVEARLLGELGTVDSIRRDGRGRVLYHYTLIDFAARWRKGEPQAADDAAEARFVPFAQLGRYGLWSETRRMIRLARQQASRPRRSRRSL
jgi:ADP-ribose pyrophosphatase YjhB (NUDIX family)